MQNPIFFKMFAAFLHSRRYVIVFFCLFILIFFVVYAAYRLDWEPALYAAILVLVLAMIFSIIRFSDFYKKHVTLDVLGRNCGKKLGKLPRARDLIERDYQTIALRLDQAKSQETFLASKQAADASQYYTLWAHQIKTPISAMRLLLSEDGEQTPEESVWKSAMIQELFKIEQYVEMVLQYNRMGNLSGDLVLAEYELSSIVTQAVKKTATLFIHKKIELALSPVTGRVLTDEKWMVFVLEQLLTNAVKYTRQGTVSIYRSDTSAGGITLVIEDTGIGIRKEDLPRIFEWGFTGFNGRDDKRSTGLGLYLCKTVTGKLGHQLQIDSQVGEGTKVSLTFSGKRLLSD